MSPDRIRLGREGYEHLRKAAEEATRGPWVAVPERRDLRPGQIAILDGATLFEARDATWEDARFVALAQPQIVLALLDEIEQRRAGRGTSEVAHASRSCLNFRRTTAHAAAGRSRPPDEDEAAEWLILNDGTLICRGCS